ncbi:T9SS type A sorting domain-containing protein [Chryseobacterium sp. G0201]|uniref:T9SS type A sorting domain-containing protein n=1 Tax=Chryseobacterium sp. G0201 TaxID=2487065 RepID=UPI000F5042A4|nr:T9SS type A sorting domain-containing protein [Chryseobacterium sp. G0201]AZA53172.1 T9SS C-terminal target domain-containing protein [Chryseobacterium sp. G0201]
MNKKITVGFFCLMTASLFCKINAQTYQTLNVTSGYNQDLIANGSGTASSSTTQSVDSPTYGYVFMSTDFINGSGVAPTSGLPSSGLINSANTAGLSFQLAPYTSNNSLRLVNENDLGVLNFSSTPKASKLFMLATAGSGTSVASVVVNFTDGSNQTFTDLYVQDWYGGTEFAIKGIGRGNRITDAVENNSNDPRLYEIALSISAANQSKSISSISVTKTSSNTSFLCVFGFSYQVANACIATDSITTSNITPNSATVSWQAIPGVSSYELYRSTSNVAPVGSTTPTDTGITTASKNITGLSPATSYNVWVRSNCGGGSVSDWSIAAANFTTSCMSVNAPYTEDFNSTATGTLPMCTSQQVINPGGDWIVDNATGLAGFTSNVVYTTNSTTNDANTWFYTNGVNLQAGTSYTFTFDYANYASPQNFKVAYGTSPIDTSMTNVISDFANVDVSSYTPGSFTITPSTSGVYYLGFNVYTTTDMIGSFGVMMFDNISLTTSSLSTSENLLSQNMQVYPNPTSDYLNIKGAKKVSGIKVFDVSGRVVLSSDKAEQRLDVSQLTKGAYILNLKNADGTSSTNKFIKK